MRTPFTKGLSATSYSATAWVLLIALLSIAAVRAPYLFSDGGAGSLIVTSTPLVLAAMAITVTAIVGSGVDLSVGPLMVFVNVCLVRFLFDNQIGSPLIVVLVALGLGVAVQVLQAIIITVARIEPVIVTLSAFLALSGLNLVILDKPQGQAPRWLATWGSGFEAINPMTILLLISIAAWVLVSRTPFFANIRLVGANPRTAFVSGIPIVLTRIGAHVIAGLFIGAAGLAYTGMIASGNPGQGDTYTLAAITALVLGGTSLAGGRGGILGTVPGALAVAMISFTLTTFSLGALSGFVTQLTYGLILVLALTSGILVPRIISARKAARA
ncbi:ABC transporter permease [Rhodoglobus aureus]|uniref:Autoinducer 2 import system permease protein LsrD n=1 Tax=Rhodoglobus aureus TaxID=191497 RepID=A0ABN1VJT1_9MICO